MNKFTNENKIISGAIILGLSLLILWSVVSYKLIEELKSENVALQSQVALLDDELNSVNLVNENLMSLNSESTEQNEKLKAEIDSLKLKNEELEKTNSDTISILNKKEAIPSFVFYDDLINLDVTTPSFLSSDELDNIFEGTNLEGLGKYYIKAENETGINALVQASITALETGHGTSYAFNYKNNTHGNTVNGEVISFDSVEESILKSARNLKNNYVSEGRNTINKIHSKYCPPDEQWANKVADIFKSYCNSYINIKRG